MRIATHYYSVWNFIIFIYLNTIKWMKLHSISHSKFTWRFVHFSRCENRHNITSISSKYWLWNHFKVMVNLIRFLYRPKISWVRWNSSLTRIKVKTQNRPTQRHLLSEFVYCDMTTLKGWKWIKFKLTCRCLDVNRITKNAAWHCTVVYRCEIAQSFHVILLVKALMALTWPMSVPSRCENFRGWLLPLKKIKKYGQPVWVHLRWKMRRLKATSIDSDKATLF